MKKSLIFGLALLLSILLAACSNNNNHEGHSVDKQSKPIAEKPSETNNENLKNSSYYFTANEGGSITIIDSKTNEVINTIEVDGTAHNVQVSPDGALLGVTLVPSSHGGHGSHGEKMNGSALFYDIQSNELLHEVEVGAHPAHIVFSNDNKYVLVTNSEDNNITVIDAATFSVVKTITTGKGPHGFRISKDSKFAYIANMGESSVSVVDLVSMEETRKIEVGATPVTTSITSDGKTLITTLNEENAVAIVDLTNDQVEKITVGSGPAQVFIQPDDQYAFVANQGTEENPSKYSL